MICLQYSIVITLLIIADYYSDFWEVDKLPSISSFIHLVLLASASAILRVMVSLMKSLVVMLRNSQAKSLLLLQSRGNFHTTHHRLITAGQTEKLKVPLK